VHGGTSTHSRSRNVGHGSKELDFIGDDMRKSLTATGWNDGRDDDAVAVSVMTGSRVPAVSTRMPRRITPVLSHAVLPVSLFLTSVQLESSTGTGSIDPFPSVGKAVTATVASFTAATVAACFATVSVEPWGGTAISPTLDMVCNGAKRSEMSLSYALNRSSTLASMYRLTQHAVFQSPSEVVTVDNCLHPRPHQPRS